MRNVLVTGANRGIGLGFVKHYLSEGDRVWATYRDDVTPLVRLDSPACNPLKWDVTEALSEPEQTKLPVEINLLINNAGIYGSRENGQNLEQVTQAELLSVFKIDAAAPLQVVQSLLPRLIRGKATVANMSSKMGSSSDNGSGGVYAYRAAKSALCIISKSMAIDLAKYDIKVLCLHPGWVQTDMTKQTGLIDVQISVAGLTSVIDNIRDYPPGAFVAFDGAIIPY